MMSHARFRDQKPSPACISAFNSLRRGIWPLRDSGLFVVVQTHGGRAAAAAADMAWLSEFADAAGLLLRLSEGTECGLRNHIYNGELSAPSEAQETRAREFPASSSKQLNIVLLLAGVAVGGSQQLLLSNRHLPKLLNKGSL